MNSVDAGRGGIAPLVNPAAMAHRRRRASGRDAESSSAHSESLGLAGDAVLPANQRVLERERQQALALLREQQLEQANSLNSPDPYRSRDSSSTEEPSTMANRRNEPAVPLAVLKRMQLVFELHEWRMERRRDSHLCFMSPNVGGDGLGGTGEDDIETMLRLKEKQRNMEMQLRATKRESDDQFQDASPVHQSIVTEPNPGIPFHIFERDIVEPFFDVLFPTSKGVESAHISHFSNPLSATNSQGVTTQPAVSGSCASTNYRVFSRSWHSQKTTYQRRRASHVEAAENLFRLVDTNVDGFISWDEMSNYILQIGQRLLAEDDSLQRPSGSLQKRGGAEDGGDGAGTASSRMLTFAPFPTNTGVWEQQYPLVRFLHHTQPICKLLSSRGRRYVTIAWDGLMKLWRHDPCLSDARGKQAIVHERNLFAAGAPIIDAVLSPESFGDSEMAVVAAIDGTVTLLRVTSGEVLKTFIGRCSMPAPFPMRCVSSSKENPRTWRPDGHIGDVEISEDLRTHVEGRACVLRPTFKVKAYHRDAIDIFFTDVSRYFSGLGVVAPTFEHLERRRPVRADILESFGDGSDAVEVMDSDKPFRVEMQERLSLKEGNPEIIRSSENAGRSSFTYIPESDSDSDRDGNMEAGSGVCNMDESSAIFSCGRGVMKGDASASRSVTTHMEKSVALLQRKSDANPKAGVLSQEEGVCSQSEFREAYGKNDVNPRRKSTRQYASQLRQSDSEKSWFARSVALARHDPQTTSHLPAGAYLLLGFETGVLQLYRMRMEWFSISNLCTTRVEPPAKHAPVLAVSLHRAAITHILFSESNGLVMTGSDDARIVVRQLGRIHVPFVTLGEGVPPPGTIPSHNHGHTRRITCMCSEPTRGLLVTGAMDRHVFSWLPTSSRPMQHIDLRDLLASSTRHSGYPIDVSFMQPPRQPLLLLVLDSRRTIFLFDAVAFNCVHILCDDSPGSLRGGSLLRVCYDVGDDRLVLAGKYLRTWDTACDDTYPHDYQGHRRPLVGLAFQRYWRFWVSADDTIIIVWKGEVSAGRTQTQAPPSSGESRTSSTGWAFNTTPLRSWCVESGITFISVDQTECAHIFVSLLRERCIEEYNIFSGSVLRTFKFPAKVGEISSLACSAPVLGAPPPAIYNHLSPLSFVCGTFERGQSRDGTTALYSLGDDSGGLDSYIHRLVVTSEVGVSIAVIIASVGLVVVGHRGGISVTPFDESTTCPIPCLRLTDKPPKDAPVGMVRQRNVGGSISGNPPPPSSSLHHQKRYSCVRLPPPSAKSSKDQGPHSAQGEGSAETSSDRAGHCRPHPPLDLVALFPGPLVQDPVAITRECMLHREQYLFHDSTNGGTTTAPSGDTRNYMLDGENTNRNKNMSCDQNNGLTRSTQPLLLFSEEFTATASKVGSSFGVFLREQLSSLGFVLHVAPVADTAYIATGSDDGLVQFWNLRTTTEVLRFRATYTIDTVTAMDVCSSASYIAVGDTSGYVLLVHIGSVPWEKDELLEMIKGIEAGIRVEHRWRGHKQGISSVRFVHSSSHSPQSNSARVSQVQTQRRKSVLSSPASRPRAATLAMADVASQAKCSAQQTDPVYGIPQADDMGPVFLCTSGEDTYIYAWCWQPKQKPTGIVQGELQCIGCFGGAVEIPPVPPLGKWTESSWRVLDTVRRLYVAERLMSPSGPLGAAGFTPTSSSHPSTKALEKAAAFIREDMQTVRETGASLCYVPPVSSGRSHGGEGRRNVAHDAPRSAARRRTSLHLPRDLAPTLVFAFEEGSYYDRDLMSLLARIIEEIKGCKLTPPMSPEEAVLPKTEKSAKGPLTGLGPTEDGRPTSAKEERKAAQAQPREQGPKDEQFSPKVPVLKSLVLPEALQKGTVLNPTAPAEQSSISLQSGIPAGQKPDLIDNETGVLQEEVPTELAVVLLPEKTSASPLTPLHSDAESGVKSRNSLTLPRVGHISANRSQHPLASECVSPSGRYSSPRQMGWDQLPSVAVTYETAAPLPRLRRSSSLERGIAGVDVAKNGAELLENRLPVLSQIMSTPGSPKTRSTGPVEKVMLNKNPRQNLFPSKFFERYTGITTDPLQNASGSEERIQARRARKRIAMLWGPARVMNTLMSWKAPLVDIASSTGLRRLRARDHDTFCDTDEGEVSLPTCIPLVLGIGSVGPRPGSGPLVERRASAVLLEAEVSEMRNILNAAVLDKQQLAAEERATTNLS